MSVARTLIKLREFQTYSAGALAYGNESSTVTTVKGALDWLFAVLYPQSKDSVATFEDLPLINNEINDYRIVIDDGDGKAASYRWEMREGDLEPSWHKIHDMDWSTDSILATFMNETQDLYVYKNGRMDLNASGNQIAGLYEGQTIYGGSSSGNLTLNANAGDQYGPQSGYVQFDGNTRPTSDDSFDLGTSTKRFRDIFVNGALKDGVLTITLQGIQDAIDHATETGNPHSTSYDDLTNRLGTLSIDGDVSGSVDLSSTGDKTLTLTISNDSHTHDASSTIIGFDTGIYENLKESLVDTGELTWVFDDAMETIAPDITIDTGVIQDIEAPQASSILASNPGGDKWIPVTPNIELTGEVTGSASYDGGWSIETLIESCPLDKIDGIILDNKSFNSVAGSPTFIYAPAHGLLNGEKVHLYGGITGSHIITWVDSDTFSIAEETFAPESGHYIPQGAQFLFDPDLNKFKIAKEYEEIRLAELSGLNEDVLTQYVALAGRTGGQVVHGSTSPSGTLVLDSTSNATKGSVETKSKLTPFADATYFATWSGTDLGSATKRWNDLYLAGEAKGLRFEKVTSLPLADGREIGRTVIYNGEIYFNNGSEFTKLEAGTSTGGSSVNTVIDSFSGNGSQLTFTLSTVPLSKEKTRVFISGVYQSKSTYSIAGNVLTFSEAPPTGVNNIEVEIFEIVSGPDAVVTADATTTSKGVIQLAGDLAGTASLPTVPGLATKVNKTGANDLSGTFEWKTDGFYTSGDQRISTVSSAEFGQIYTSGTLEATTFVAAETISLTQTQSDAGLSYLTTVSAGQVYLFTNDEPSIPNLPEAVTTKKYVDDSITTALAAFNPPVTPSGGGGSSLIWDKGVSNLAPVDVSQDGLRLEGFTHTDSQEIYLIVTVPESYVPGTPIILKGGAVATPATFGSIHLKAETTLIRANSAFLGSYPNKRTSINQALYLTTFANFIMSIGDIDLTDDAGNIVLAVYPGDKLRIRLFRDIENEAPPAEDVAKVFINSFEIKFN